MRDLISAILLIVLLVFAVNPMDFWMPDAAHRMVLAGLVALVGIVISFVVREGTEDERDLVHRAFAGRAAFLVGAAVLISGIVIQGFNGDVDPWLAVSLASVVVAKIVARVYSDRYC